MAIRYKPTDQLDVTLSTMLDLNYLNTLPNYEPVLSTSESRRTANQFQLQPQNTNYSLSSLEAVYDFGPVSLHSISGYIDRRHSSLLDATGTLYNVLGGNGLVPAPSVGQITFAVDEKIFSQEFRAEGKFDRLFGSSMALDWSGGVFYQNEARRAVGNATVEPAWLTEAQAPLGVPPSGTTTVWAGLYTATYKNKAAFGNLTLHLLPRLSISGGVRYSDQTLSAIRTDFSDVFSGCAPTATCSLPEPASGTQLTPRATIEFAVTDEANLYAAYSTGFRIGGFNSVGSISTPGCLPALEKFGVTDPAAVAKYDTDKLRNIEAGMKSLLFSRRLSLNVSVFQEDWTNLQSTIALNQYSRACGGNFIANAGAARVDGAEVEARTKLTSALSLYATGQYQNARIVSVEPGSVGTLGAPLQSAPRVQLASGVEYALTPRAGWDATTRLDYAYVGARNMSNTNTPVDPHYQLPGYSTLNLRFEVAHERWAFMGYVNNLTDSVPQLGVQVFAGGPGDYTGGYAQGALRQVPTGPPRVVGILVRRDF